MDILEVKNLVKTFPRKGGRVRAVDGISLNVRKGEFFGLLGVNGAGKSTTLTILSGLIKPDSGEIKIFGKDFFKHDTEIKQKFNIATAYYSLSHNLTVKQNLNVYARIYNVKNREQKIHDLSEKFMIRHLYKTKVRALSSGEKTRLSITKALLNDPELLFLDECTVGLDPDMAEITRKLLKDYNLENNCTIIFTSHYMQEVEQLCDRIAFMNEGKIIKIGKAKDLVEEMKMQRVHLHFSRNIKKAQNLLRDLKIDFQTHGGEITFQIKNRNKIIFPILEKFVNEKIIFDDLHLSKPTLEDYFISKSRKK